MFKEKPSELSFLKLFKNYCLCQIHNLSFSFKYHVTKQRKQFSKIVRLQDIKISRKLMVSNFC